jgi:hypothetical protein
MIQGEKAGKPAVAIVSGGFETDAEASARAFGMPGFRYARVPDVLTGLPTETIRAEMEAALSRIVEVLTTDVDGETAGVTAALRSVSTERLRFRGEDRYDAFEVMNQAFLENRWADGFLLTPPTEERVVQMLKGTTRSPQDVVTFLPPGNGLATVEKIAINAVMAGCKPEHLPVLMAAAAAITALDKEDGNVARGMTMSTGPHAPFLVINGPIRKELGVNCGRAAMGPGAQSWVNIVIGRAVRLMLMNVGHAYPGEMDMDTQGSPRKFSHCVGENEEESPWSPLHVEHGFPSNASTVSIFPVRDEIEVNDMENWRPEGVLNSFAFFGAIPGGEYVWRRHANLPDLNGYVLLVAPEHAHILGRDGWSKQGVKEYVHHHCQASVKRLINKTRNVSSKFAPQWQWLLALSEEQQERVMLPVLGSVDCYDVVVMGGPVGKSQILRTLGSPSIVEIKDRAL